MRRRLADDVYESIVLGFLIASLVAAAQRDWWLALLFSLCSMYALLLGGTAAFMAELWWLTR